MFYRTPPLPREILTITKGNGLTLARRQWLDAFPCLVLMRFFPVLLIMTQCYEAPSS